MSPFALLKKYLFEKFIHIYFYSVTVSLFNNFSHFYISTNQFRFLTIAKLQHEHLFMTMLQKKLSPDFQLKPRLSIHHLNDIMLKLFMRTQEMVACNTFCLLVAPRKNSIFYSSWQPKLDLAKIPRVSNVPCSHKLEVEKI